jgi:hypothetical protein
MYPVDNMNNFMLCLEMYFFGIQVFCVDYFKLFMYLYQGVGYGRILEIIGIMSEMDRACSTKEIF